MTVSIAESFLTGLTVNNFMLADVRLEAFEGPLPAGMLSLNIC